MMGMPNKLVRTYTAVSRETRRRAGGLPTANRANRREFETGPLRSRPNLRKNLRLQQRCVRFHFLLSTSISGPKMVTVKLGGYFLGASERINS